MTPNGPLRASENELDLAIALLASGATYAQAAAAAGVSERTVKRRMADPAFRQQVNDLRGEMVLQTVGALTKASTKAVETLIDLMDPASPPSVRLGASKAVLDAETSYRESAALDERIRLLEQALTSSSQLAS